MARTIVEWEPKRGASSAKIVNELKKRYEEDQRNLDVAGDLADSDYYAGRVDALGDLISTYGWKVK